MRGVRLIAVLSALMTLGVGVARADVSTEKGLGSLAVSNGAGTVTVHGTGVIFGVVGQGSLVLFGYQAGVAGATPAVTGATAHLVSGAVVYAGTDVRFLLPEGHYSIAVSGSGIDLSAVGRGSISVAPSASGAAPSAVAGELSINGATPGALSAAITPESFGGHSGAS